MELNDKVIVVTGAASGIGEAMVRRFAKENPRGLVLADLNLAGAQGIAEEVGGLAVETDVSSPESNAELITTTETQFGPIDLFCANAGYGIAGDEQNDPEDWDRMWSVNVMSHVHAARLLTPGWLERGEGYFLATASAAGLLTNLGAAQYSVTKHAAVAFAEWLAVTYGDRGVRVSCLCPQFVDTPLVEAMSELENLITTAPVLDPATVADVVVAGIGDESFLILPHLEVEEYFQHKAADYDRWIGGMQKLRQNVFPAANQAQSGHG